ncbi:MAG: type II secretion system GspH family protein [Alphaproteobacteria bacterium]|uniref:Type II secretion system GspH family protein n=1 Tax=Candidatus Nitrobium versatile TaxID=2884831 RepID=A0A953LVZ5_9BACT|nr:type II secretion system GspH family protein [Candidatus Nitrobium versatile]
MRTKRLHRQRGFTLLEVLVALAVLGIALLVIIQLFSANMRSLSASEEYSAAVVRAEGIMREVLDDEDLAEKSWSFSTDDGYQVDVEIQKQEEDRIAALPVQLLDISLTVRWKRGTRERSFVLTTLKTVARKV